MKLTGWCMTCTASRQGKSRWWKERVVATVRVVLTVGFSLDDEPTVNSNGGLTVATTTPYATHARAITKQA